MPPAEAAGGLRYATPEWFGALHRATVEAVDRHREASPEAAAQLTYSMSEIITGAPDDLSPDGADLGWYCAVEAGRITAFEPRPRRDAGRVVIADYDTLLACTRFRTEADPARWQAYQAMTHDMWEQGRITVTGEMPALPPAFGAIHDTIARLTA